MLLPTRRSACALAFAGLLSLTPFAAQAEPLAGADLVNALRHGGFVLVMRHANAVEVDKTTANPDNTKLERQLDLAAKNQTNTIAVAFKNMRLPVGNTWSSPAYRALETAKYAGLPAPKADPKLGDEGVDMTKSPAIASPETGAYLKAKAAELPRADTNSVIVTHLPNITAAFGDGLKDIAPAETLVFQPDGKGGAELVARVKGGEWHQMEKL